MIQQNQYKIYLQTPFNTSSTVTDSNALQVPTRNIVDNNNHVFNKENPSALSVTNTSEIQTSSIHDIIQRNYDPPPPPSNRSIHSTPHNSPQQGSSNIFSTRQPTLNETQFQTTTPPTQSPQTIPYIPAQPPVQSVTPPTFTINTLHTNRITNVTTSHTLSRPPIPLIQTNPLSYNITSTNTHSQFSSHNTQSNPNVQPFYTIFQTHIPSTINQPPQPVLTLSIQTQLNVLNILSTSSNPSTTQTIPPTTIPLSTLNTPTQSVHNQYTICTLLSLFFPSNNFLLILLTIITVFLQNTFKDKILPYPINFTTKHFFTQYLFPLINNSYYDP